MYGSGPGAMGYDPSEGWDAAIWVLHAIYEWPDLAPRLTWSELTQRDGIEFWAVDGRWPDRRYTPQSDWADSATMPAFSGPRIGPTTESAGRQAFCPRRKGHSTRKPAGVDRGAGTIYRAQRATRLRRLLQPGRIHGRRRHGLRR